MARRRVGHDSESHACRCRELMQQRFALFTAGVDLQDISPQLANACQPGTKILGQLRVDFAAQPLRHGGALAGSGDGDLQISASHDGPEEEIAIGNVVDAVAENAAFEGGAIDGGIHFRHVGCGDHEIMAVEI